MPVRYLARTPNWGVRPGGELSHPAELAPIIGSPESHPEVDDAPGHFELTAPMMHSKNSGLRRRRHTPRVLGWLRTRGVVIIPAVFMSVAILHHLIAPLQAPPGNHTHSSSREHHQHSEAPSALPRGPGGIGVLIGDDSTRPDGEAVQPPPALSPPPAPPATLVSTALVMCPTWAPALGFGGATAALSLSCLGSAYGTGKAGIGISTIGVHAPDIVMKNVREPSYLHPTSILPRAAVVFKGESAKDEQDASRCGLAAGTAAFTCLALPVQFVAFASFPSARPLRKAAARHAQPK